MADTAPEVKEIEYVENRFNSLLTQEEVDKCIELGHVPTDGVIPDVSNVDFEKFDILNGEIWRRDAMWPFLKWMRENDPVHYTPDSLVGPYWSITKYEDIMAVDTNHKQFSSDSKYGGITAFDITEDFMLPMFIAMDPPKHDDQRKVVQPIVGPDNLKLSAELIRERTCMVLDSLPVGEAFDWVDKVSIELTTMMLATLFDFPFEQRRKLTRWSDVATGRGNPDVCPGGEEQWQAELMECLGFFMDLWKERAQTETPGNDLISMLAHGEATKNMEPQEFLGNLILLIVGGNDTTRNSMSGSVYATNKFPKEFEKLKANQKLIPSFVSEIIRWQTPLAHMRRTATEDVELGGKTIKKGDKVLMWYVSGNRDETVIERPDEVWIDRPNVRRHLSFGFGIHRCVGNRLGEMQLQILWEEFFKRFDRVEVLEEPERTRQAFVKGYTKMMVKLHPKAA